MFNKIICFLCGHVWGNPTTTKEDWHTFEDITDTGGLMLGYAPGKASGEFEEDFIHEVTTHQCRACEKVEGCSPEELDG